MHWADGFRRAADATGAMLAERGVKRVVKARLDSNVEEWLPDVASRYDLEIFDADTGPDVESKIAYAEAGLTEAAFAIAETGTLVEATFDDAHRLVSALPRIHLCLLKASDIVLSLRQASGRIRKLLDEKSPNCVISFISGPSRTADIEMRLVMGVHGPHEVHAIIIR